MNLWRALIVAVWLMLHAGGYVFARLMSDQKRQWADMGTELSSLAVQTVMAADLLVKYGYIASLAVTILCAVLWSAASSKVKISE